MLHISCDILQVLHPAREVVLCFEDEMRTGLHPTLRRMWAERGSQPSYPSDIRYDWLYAFAFVFPEDGENHWWLLPTVTIAVMNVALREFALQANPDGTRLIVLVVDQAGFHSWKRLTLPDGIILRFLPPHSPELQPVESVWPLVNEATCNQSFRTIDDLEQVLITRTCYLMDHPSVVEGRTGFGWTKRSKKECIT
jgi:hypothetical protein